MTPEKMLRTIEKYRVLFNEGKFNKKKHPLCFLIRSEVHVVEHCHAMLDEIELLVRTRKFVRARQELRFVQGALFAIGVLKLEEIDADNRDPENDTPPG